MAESRANVAYFICVPYLFVQCVIFCDINSHRLLFLFPLCQKINLSCISFFFTCQELSRMISIMDGAEVYHHVFSIFRCALVHCMHV